MYDRAWIATLATPIPSNVILGKLLSLSESVLFL